MSASLRIFSAFAFVLAALALVAGCGRPSKALPEKTQLEALGEGEIASYELLNEVVFTPKCLGCHKSMKSLEDMVQGRWITSGTPSASPLYTSVASGRMPKNGPPLSPREIEVIGEWIQAGAPSLEKKQEPVTPTPPPVVEPVFLPKFSAILKNIIAPRCQGCHDQFIQEDQLILEDFQQVSALVKPGNALESKLYQVVFDDSMPKDNAPLTPPEKEAIRLWIEAGALED